MRDRGLLVLLWLSVMAPGPVLADEVPSTARALWADLTDNAKVVPAFLALPSTAPTGRTRLEHLAVLHKAAQSGEHPAAPALHDLFLGLSDLESLSWADADVPLSRCVERPVPADPLARAAHVACAVYDALVALQIGRPADAVRGFAILSASRHDMTTRQIGGLLRSATDGGYDVLEAYLLTPLLLRDLFYGSGPGSTDLFSRVVEEVETIRAADAETGRAVLQRLGMLQQKLLAEWEGLPNRPQRRVAQALVERGIGRAVAQMQPLVGPDEASRLAPLLRPGVAALQGDWEGSFWSRSLTRGTAEGVFALADTLEAFLPNGAPLNGPPVGVVLRHDLNELAARLGGGDWPERYTARSPRRVSSVGARLPARCHEQVQRLRDAWAACPDNLWRTFAARFPHGSPPILGAPTSALYQRVSDAARALTGPCRVAVAPELPVSIAQSAIRLPAETAIISLSLVGEAVIRRVLWTDPDGQTRRRDELRAAGAGLGHTLSLVTSLTSGPSRPFPVSLAYQTHEFLLGDLPAPVRAARHWIAAVQLGPTPLPLELLMTRETACTEITDGVSPAELPAACRELPWLGDQHDIRYAVDLRDAVSWSALAPHAYPETATVIADPVFANDPSDQRCEAGACASLPTADARWDWLLAAGRTLGKIREAPAPDPPPDVLRRLPGTRSWAPALRRLGASAGWSVRVALDMDAGEAALVDALQRPEPGLIVVGTHVTLPPQSLMKAGSLFAPLQVPTGLVLAPPLGGPLGAQGDGFISVADLASGAPRASNVALVVLSTCSGSTPVSAGRQLVSSVAAELRLNGVGSVLSHMWPVPDDAGTRPGVEVLRDALATGRPLGDVLAERARAWRVAHPHPARWANLVLHGPGHPLTAAPMSVPDLEVLVAPASEPGVVAPPTAFSPLRSLPGAPRFPWVLVIGLTLAALAAAVRSWRFRWRATFALGTVALAAAMLLRWPSGAVLVAVDGPSRAAVDPAAEATVAVSAPDGLPTLVPIPFADGVAFVVAGKVRTSFAVRPPAVPKGWDNLLRLFPRAASLIRGARIRPDEAILELGLLEVSGDRTYLFGVVALPDSAAYLSGLRAYARATSVPGTAVHPIRREGPGHFVAPVTTVDGERALHMWVRRIDWDALQTLPASQYGLDRRVLGATHVVFVGGAPAGATVAEPPLSTGAAARARLAAMAAPIGGALPGLAMEAGAEDDVGFSLVAATIPRREDDALARSFDQPRSLTVSVRLRGPEIPDAAQARMWLERPAADVFERFGGQADRYLGMLLSLPAGQREGVAARVWELVRAGVVLRDLEGGGLDVAFRSWEVEQREVSTPMVEPWSSYRSEKANYSVRLPTGEPFGFPLPHPTEKGRTIGRQVMASDGLGGTFIVVHVNGPAGKEMSRHAEEFLDGQIQTIAAKRNATLVDSKPISLGKFPGREFRLRGRLVIAMAIIGRIYVVNDRLYYVLAQRQQGMPDGQARAFLDSFALLRMPALQASSAPGHRWRTVESSRGRYRVAMFGDEKVDSERHRREHGSINRNMRTATSRFPHVTMAVEWTDVGRALDTARRFESWKRMRRRFERMRGVTELRSEVSLISGVPCFVLRGRMSDPGAPPVSMTVYDFHVGRRRYGLRTIGAADDSVADARAKRFFESFELIPSRPSARE